MCAIMSGFARQQMLAREYELIMNAEQENHMSLKDAMHKEKRYEPGDAPHAATVDELDAYAVREADTHALLKERESTHGDFEENAICCEKMYRAWAARWLHAHGSEVPFPMAHAMYHKFSKLSRLAANEHCQDHYDDDIGYTELARRFS